ncbi:hypothetical protein ACB092_05G226900 [Castanea dentata]
MNRSSRSACGFLLWVSGINRSSRSAWVSLEVVGFFFFFFFSFADWMMEELCGCHAVGSLNRSSRSAWVFFFCCGFFFFFFQVSPICSCMEVWVFVVGFWYKSELQIGVGFFGGGGFFFFFFFSVSPIG